VFTGGEPALQLTESLVDDFQQHHFECAFESNGTLPLPKNLDWVCISPKGKSDVIIKHCHELKLVYPQVDLSPDDIKDIQADYYYLSPMADYGVENSGMIIRENMQGATQYCLDNPQWRMSLQTHKLLGIN
jgi:organic radical activating enzyme